MRFFRARCVVLDMGQRANGPSECPTRARVKWIQKLNTASDPAYGVAVEFESAGNIWGLASPPEDWFPVQGRQSGRASILDENCGS